MLDIIQQHQNDYRIGLVGSSLGGDICLCGSTTNLVFKAVVVNPAVKPYELLADYLGEQVNPYTNERYVLTEAHIDELKALDTPVISQVSDFWLLQQEGDEVLDYRQAVSKFTGAKQTVEANGDHSFVGF
ncbi:YqiA/YcfP family alpha/beta fold hydrolase [Vibrio sinaloensis]|nr:YqiA/YcfP family alpha/beta fold hydrolase [Vibrio sinaloensis]